VLDQHVQHGHPAQLPRPTAVNRLARSITLACGPLHMRATGVRGGGEAVEGLWRISLEAVDGWTLQAGTEDDRGPFARLLGNP
jgi:hypothetical protein